MWLSLRTTFRAMALASLGLGLLAGMRADEGHVIIRVPAGASVPAELAPLLAKWKQGGQVAGALLLEGGRTEKSGGTAKFAAFAVLDFASESAADQWQVGAAASLPAGLIVRRANVLAEGRLPHEPSVRSIFVVNTYTPTVPAGRFRDYVRGYVQPLYEAMMASKDLVRFTAYAERGEVGKVDALNVLEYRDAAAFDDMGTKKSEIRKQVAAAVPTYAQYDKIKDSLRIDGFGTSATWVPLR